MTGDWGISCEMALARMWLEPVTWHWCMMCLFSFLSTLSFLYMRQVTQLDDMPHGVAEKSPGLDLLKNVHGSMVINLVVSSMPKLFFRKCLARHRLTHWGQDKMANIFQTTFSNAFSCLKICEFGLRFHWNLFPRFKLTIFQHWFR